MKHQNYVLHWVQNCDRLNARLPHKDSLMALWQHCVGKVVRHPRHILNAELSTCFFFFYVWALTCRGLPRVDAKLIALWSPPPDANGIQSDLKRKKKKWVNNELKGTSFKCAVVARLTGRNEKATSHSLIPQPLYLWARPPLAPLRLIEQEQKTGERDYWWEL